MDFGSINLVVKDPDAALITHLKLFGTNNVEEVIKLQGLKDDSETVDGYYLKTKPLNLAIYTPRDSSGRMGKFMAKNGEGTHHLTFHMGQDEFEQTYQKFKQEGRPVSEKIIYIGKFSQAMFWLDGTGEQGVPLKFATTCYQSLSMWENTNYLDTPKHFEKLKIKDEYLRPRIVLNTAIVTVNEFEKQQNIWSSILARTGVEQGDIFRLLPGKVEDGRGNIFVPIRYQFADSKGINLYCALNKEAPINKIMSKRGVNGMIHNSACYVTRDRVHEYFGQLEEAGFSMVDPKPALNTNKGNGNYFFFIHPRSAHGVLWEVVSVFTRDDAVRARYDFSDTSAYMVPPGLN